MIKSQGVRIQVDPAYNKRMGKFSERRFDIPDFNIKRRTGEASYEYFDDNLDDLNEFLNLEKKDGISYSSQSLKPYNTPVFQKKVVNLGQRS